MPAVAVAVTLALTAAAYASAVNRGHGLSYLGPEERFQPGNSSEVLARSLRRRLVEHNYDYTSAESEETLAPRPSEPPREEAGRKEIARETVLDEEGDGSDEKYVMRNRQLKENKRKIQNPGVDEMYHQSRPTASDAASLDEHLKRIIRARIDRKLATRTPAAGYLEDLDEDIARRYMQGSGDKASYEDNSLPDHSVGQSTPTVKYKVLQARHPYRRSGDVATLIQEEAPDRVSIVNLGAGPFPEFRLPPPRRQYMRVPQPLRGLGDEEELPPPPADETTAADVAAGAEGRALGYKEDQSSLRMTITPNGILVL